MSKQGAQQSTLWEPHSALASTTYNSYQARLLQVGTATWMSAAVETSWSGDWQRLSRGTDEYSIGCDGGGERNGAEGGGGDGRVKGVATGDGQGRGGGICTDDTTVRLLAAVAWCTIGIHAPMNLPEVQKALRSNALHIGLIKIS